MRPLTPRFSYRVLSALARRMAKVATLLTLTTIALIPSAHAAQWMDVATISSTLTNTAGRLCVGGGRTDIGCPANSPLLDSAAGLLTVPGDLRVIGNLYVSGSQQFDGVTFSNGGVSATGTVTATSFTGSGAGLSGIPASAVVGLSTDRIVSDSANVVAGNGGTISFTTGGISGTAYIDTTGRFVAAGVSTTGSISGVTGYFANNLGIGTTNPSTSLHVSGTLRIANGGETCDANRLGAIRYTAGSFDICKNTINGWEPLATATSSTTPSIDTGLSGSIVFRDQSGYLKAYNSFSISSTTGSVGIGAGAPASLGASGLYISGSLQTNDELTVKGIANLNKGILFNQGSAGAANMVYLGSTAPGAVNASMGMFAAGVGSTTANQGAYFVVRGNTFNDLGNQRGAMLFAAGNPTSPFGYDGSIQFWTGNEVRRMIIDKDGRIGIGTADTASTTLQVSGTLKIANGGESCDIHRIGAIKYQSSAFYVCQNTANGWEALATTGENSLADRITSTSQAGVIANATGYISLTTGGVTGTAYFAPNGRLVTTEISTTSTISATDGYFTGLRVGSPNNITNAITPFQSYANISGNYSGIGGMELRNTNNGINADFRFVVSDNLGTSGNYLAFSMPSSNNNNTLFSNTRQNLAAIFTGSGLGYSGNGRDLALGTVNAGSLIFGTTNAERMRIVSNGLVGIGTRAPSTTLHVSGTLRIADGAEACDANRTGAIRYNSGQFYVCRNGTTWETMVAGASGTADTDRITSGTTSVITYNNASATITTAGVERMVIGTNGNVGIGTTTNPNGKLQVSGTVSAPTFAADPSDNFIYAGKISSATIPHYGLTWNFSDGGEGLSSFLSGFEGINFFTGSGQRMRINRNGLVGIGIRDPSTTLQLAGSLRLGTEISATLQICDANRTGAIRYASGQFYVCRNGTTWETMVAGASGTADTDRITSGTTSVITYNNASATIATAGVERLVVGTNGQIGIGQQPVAPYSISISGSTSLVGRLNMGSGNQNLYIGNSAGISDLNGNNNLAIGNGAFVSGSLGASDNLAIGNGSMGGAVATGTRNVALGRESLYSATSAYENTAIGRGALYGVTTGTANTALGTYAGYSIYNQSYNTAIGNGSMGTMSANSNYTTAVGALAFQKFDAQYSVAVGYAAGQGTGSPFPTSYNTFVGSYAGVSSSAGNSNTLLGYRAGADIINGSSNLMIGANTTPFSSSGDNQLNIANAIFGDYGRPRAARIGINVTSPTANLEVSGTVSATRYVGDGSLLTNISASSISGLSSDRIISGTTSVIAGNNTSVTIATNNVQRVIVGTGGQVGIAQQPEAAYSLAVSGSTKIRGTLDLNSATNNNLFIGSYAGDNNTGTDNIAIGLGAGEYNQGGFSNFLGQFAGQLNTGNNVFALGHNAARNNSGAGTLAIGNSSAISNTAADLLAIGYMAGANNQGSNVTAIGINSAQANQATGTTAVGHSTLAANTTGLANTATGFQALQYNETGSFNTAVGYRAGTSSASTNFNGNTLIGAYAGTGLTMGAGNPSASSNTIIGANSGIGLTTGNNNILIGASISAMSNTGSNQLNIGNAIFGNIGSGLGYANLIGINVASATTALEVSGTVSATRFVGDGSLLTGIGGGTPDRIVSGTTGMYAYNNTSATIVTAGVERLIVGSNGKVAIGQQPGGFYDLAISGTLVTRGAANAIFVADRQNIISTSGIYRSNNMTSLWDNTAGGTDRLTINNTNGNVGIGTSTPSTTLQVSGTTTTDYLQLVGVSGSAGVSMSSGGGADNLGNHTATQNLDMAGFSIVNATGLNLDRISTTGVSSGSGLAMVVASTGSVSFTLAGTAGAAYIHPVLGFVGPGVSTTGTISGTVVATPLLKLIGVAGSAGVSLTSAGDNLGNHTATQALTMAGFNITGAGIVSASGNIKTTAALQAGNTDTTCATTADYGKIRFDSATKRAFLCRP